jgi:excisionase family DNA binding protein
MHRRLQFGMRENPASDRRHGSRQLARSTADDNYIKDDHGRMPSYEWSGGAPASVNAASPHAATVGKKNSAAKRTVAVPSGSLATIPPDFEPLIGSCEAARLLGNIHVKALQRYARRGNLPGYQIGGHWYFRASELDSWLRSRLNSNCQPADRVDLVKEQIS